MKPHGWLSWCISYFARGKVNNWMSKYLPAPLQGKSGQGLHHSWENGSNCEEPRGNQGEHILHRKQHHNPAHSGFLRALQRSQWSGPASLLLLTGLQPHTLFLVLKLQAAYFFFDCSPSTRRAPEFSAYPGHSSDVSEASRLLSHTFSLPHPNLLLSSPNL